MARTSRGRREAYDNIQVGGGAGIITTRERTIAGALPPDFTTYGNTENIKVGSDYAIERVIVKGTSLMTGERLG